MISKVDRKMQTFKRCSVCDKRFRPLKVSGKYYCSQSCKDIAKRNFSDLSLYPKIKKNNLHSEDPSIQMSLDEFMKLGKKVTVIPCYEPVSELLRAESEGAIDMKVTGEEGFKI